MKILYLTLNKKWFDMIKSGVKKEEYREIKPHWKKRLLNKSFDVIHFRNGYGKNDPQMIVEHKGMLEGLGIIEWGAPEGKKVYILKLGNILKIF